MSKPETLLTWAPKAAGMDTPPLPLDTQLQLSPYVTVVRDNGLIGSLDLGGRRISFPATAREWVTRIIDACVGRTISEAADHAELDADEALDLLQQLYHAAVMQNASDGLIPALAFAKHIDSLSLGFQVRLGDVFHAGVREPRSPRVTLGRFIEEYHFIISNCQHVAPAILNAPNERLRLMWCDYIADEYWHGVWIRKGLVRAGMSEEQIVNSDPLPGTTCVIRYLQWTATSDPLAYAVCLTSGESHGLNAERVRHRYENLVSSGLVADEVVDPFREHELVDLEHEHHSFAGEVFAEYGPLTRLQQDNVRRAMMTYHHILFEQKLQIIRYYLAEDAPIPFTADQLPRFGQVPLADPLDQAGRHDNGSTAAIRSSDV